MRSPGCRAVLFGALFSVLIYAVVVGATYLACRVVPAAERRWEIRNHVRCDERGCTSLVAPHARHNY